MFSWSGLIMNFLRWTKEIIDRELIFVISLALELSSLFFSVPLIFIHIYSWLHTSSLCTKYIVYVMYLYISTLFNIYWVQIGCILLHIETVFLFCFVVGHCFLFFRHHFYVLNSLIFSGSQIKSKFLVHADSTGLKESFE